VALTQANLYVGETPAQFQVDLQHVTATNPDFITLNEVYQRTDQQLTPSGYDAWHPDGPRDARDTAVLWRTDSWQPIDHGAVLMHDRPVKWGTRYITWVKLQSSTDGSVLTVIAGHASPAGPDRDGLFDLFLEQLLTSISEHRVDGPVLFGGDLNVPYPHRNPSAAAAFEARLAAAGAQTTYATLGEPVGGWATGTHYGATIDYIITAGATATSHTTSDLSYSDHRAVAATIAFGPADSNACPPSDYNGDDPTGPVGYPVPAALASTNLANWGAHGGHWDSWHTGTDFAVPCGTPVLAAHAGRAVIVPGPAWYGTQLVQVTTGPTSLTTWYAHMQTTTVTNGQPVTVGQQIGTAGDLGNTTGCHLHFEVHLHNGSIYGPDNTDPTPWLAQHIHPQTPRPAASTRRAAA
jgi:murein DD-endopeptidase MepM/ murein hydrolase activator NlpD